MISSRRQAMQMAFFGLAGIAPAPAQSSLTSAADSTPSSLIALGPRLQSESTDTKRIQRALDEAQHRGGGTVLLTAGHYTSATLQLRSNVSLWLDNGCILAMSSDNAEFTPHEKLSYDPGANQATSDFHFALLAGDNVEHIAIYGQGIIECDRKVKGGGPKPIALRNCKHVELRGITLQNAQNYNISMLGCDYVNIDSVTILRGRADGIDPDCCRYLRISNCYIESVDDSLCLKASGVLGQHSATEFVTITNCILHTASIHFKCGTESCGDFRHITVSNCILEGGAGMRHGNPGIGLYTVDEGALENVTITNIIMRDVGTPLAIIRGDRDRCATGKGPGVLRSIRISNIIATGAKLTSVVAGLPDYPVEDVHLSGISVNMVPLTNAKPAPALQAILEQPKAYPQPTMFGSLPTQGLFMRHAIGVSIRHLDISATTSTGAYLYAFDDIERIHLDIDVTTYIDVPANLIWLNNARLTLVKLTTLAPIKPNALYISGAKTTNLILKSEGAALLRKTTSIDHDVPSKAVFF